MRAHARVRAYILGGRCAWEYRCLLELGKRISSPRDGTEGSCEPPAMGAGNRTLALHALKQ